MSHGGISPGRALGLGVAVTLTAVAIALAVWLLNRSPTLQPAAPVEEVMNGRIAFVRSSGRDTEIYTIEQDGGGETDLTRGPGTRSSPAWSPDGTMIALRRVVGGQHGIHVMTADGEDVRRITRSELHDVTPAWQPLPVGR